MSDNNINKDALPAGTILKGENNQYEIEGVLGQGSFGITYKALLIINGPLGSLRTNTKVAVKEFFLTGVNGRDASVSSSISVGNSDGMFGDYMRKFKREANNLSSLHHRNVIEVLEAFESNNTAYYVMEYIEGGSLDDLIKKQNGIKEEDAKALVTQMGEALTLMHSQGMLHLDLKPSNVMLRNADTPVLIDFGLSKHFDENGAAEDSTKIGGGTPGYAPLEQSTYKKSDGIPVTMDIYALGATLFKMLTGVRPPEASDILNDGFPANELREKGVTEHTIFVINKAMASRKSDRYQTVAEFVEAMNTEPSDEPMVVEPEVEPVTPEVGGAGAGGNIPPATPPQDGEKTVIGAGPGSDEKTVIGNSRDVEKTVIGSTPTREDEKTVIGSSVPNVTREEEKPKSNALKYVLIFLGCAIVTGIIVFFIFNGRGSKEAVETDSVVETTVVEEVSTTVTEMSLSNNVGTFKYTGEINQKGQPHGKGKAVYDNGKVYDGEWVEGKMFGECVYTLPNGDEFRGTFKNDFYEKGRYTIKASGEYFEGTYKNGNPDQGKWYDKNGKQIQ